MRWAVRRWVPLGLLLLGATGCLGPSLVLRFVGCEASNILPGRSGCVNELTTFECRCPTRKAGS